MKRRELILCFLTIMACASQAASQSRSTEPVARIEEIKIDDSSIDTTTDQVQIKRAGTAAWENARKEALLFADDMVQAFRATVRMKYVLDPERVITLNRGGKLEIRTGADEGIVPNLFLIFGELFARVKGHFRVQTVQGEAVVKGTKFLVRYPYEKDTTIVVVFDGQVTLVLANKTVLVSSPAAGSIVGKGSIGLNPGVDVDAIKEQCSRWADVDDGFWLWKPKYYVPIGAGIVGGVILYEVLKTKYTEVDLTIVWH